VGAGPFFGQKIGRFVILESAKPHLTAVSTPWCGHTVDLKPYTPQLQTEREGRRTAARSSITALARSAGISLVCMAKLDKCRWMY
jgi:hypothetical protein